MVVDALSAHGLQMAPVLPQVQRILSEHGVAGHGAGLIDLTLAGTRPDLVRAVLDTLMASDDVDAVAMVIGSSSQFHPDLAVAPLRGFAGAAKPLGIYLVPAAEQSRRMLTTEGLAVFRTAESCAEGLRARLLRKAPGQEVARDTQLAGAVHAALETAGGPSLDEVASREICDLLGIAGPQGALATSAHEARRINASINGPVALKIVSPDIPHKSDQGGLVLGLDDADAVAQAFDHLMQSQSSAHPNASLRGVLVQAMADGGTEALIGYRNDPLMGPMVVLGAGGVMAEILDDTTMRVAPVDLATARDMLDDVRFLKAAQGYRGKLRGDLEALAQAIVALSQLAHCDHVAEAEINPLLIGAQGQGVLAIDALVVATPTESAKLHQRDG